MSEPSAPPPPPHGRRPSAGLHLLRRGTLAAITVVGDFFGVTEESQQGGLDTAGWGDVAQARAENAGIGTLGRRRTSAGLPPDYNTLEMGQAPRSFGNVDVSSSDSDDDQDETFFTTGGAPPPYNTLSSRTNGAHVASNSSVSARVISMYGPEDPTRVDQRPALVDVSETSPVPPPRVESARRADEYITDKEEAMRYYLNYVRIEEMVRQRRRRADAGEFFGDIEENGREQQQPPRRQRRLSSVTEARRDHRKRHARNKLERQDTMVRQEIKSLPSFWPIFTIGVTFVQVVVIIVLLSINGIAPIHIFPRTNTDNYPSLLDESRNESVTYQTFTNLWIGLDLVELIHHGAKFTPCMRTDEAIISRNLLQRSIDDDENGGLGCCQNNIWIGTTILDDCVVSRHPNLSDTQYLERTPCKDSMQLLANFHPCCISITGQCRVMHIRECLDRGGVFHTEYDSCNETNCLNDICGLNGVGERDGDPLQPTGNQGYRLILSLFIHLGVIHVVVIGLVQLYLGILIERTAGFVRVLIIYILSGVGGNLVSAIFIPYQVNGGASPAVFGFLAVHFVELFQSWQIVERAWLELLKLISVTVALLAIGTLPFVDNLAQIGGFLFGIPSAIIFLPYITFGKVDAWRKRILLIICVPILILMYIVFFILFYVVTNPNFCSFCHYLNCVPYYPGLCSNEVNDPDSDNIVL